MYSHDSHDDHSVHNNITSERLSAFTDGVMAIIITIAVLELKTPLNGDIHSLIPLIPIFITYAISFQTIGTYWNNHHHLLRVTDHISTGIMWSNLNLLFWLSLIPFATGWLGENHGGTIPTVFYSLILLLCAISYTIFQDQVVRHSSNRQEFKKELNKSHKGIISLACYVLAVCFGFYNPIISDVLIIFVAIMWFIPDKRIEKYL
ncbi:MAG: TMEM175 family protein [Candidatus Taylorbacteria bacterium]